jgi:hypothetical protein
LVQDHWEIWKLLIFDFSTQVQGIFKNRRAIKHQMAKIKKERKSSAHM